jgi:hypothetical protein
MNIMQAINSQSLTAESPKKGGDEPHQELKVKKIYNFQFPTDLMSSKNFNNSFRPRSNYFFATKPQSKGETPPSEVKKSRALQKAARPKTTGAGKRAGTKPRGRTHNNFMQGGFSDAMVKHLQNTHQEVVKSTSRI